MITKKEFENFMKEYGFKSIDDLKEEEIIKEIKELKQQLVKKNKEIEFMATQLMPHQKSMSEICAFYDSKREDEKDALKEYIQQLEREVDILSRNQIQNLTKEKEIKELKQQLAKKDKEIDALKQEREFMLDEVKNRGTCGLCEKLENKEINELRQQLAEKDKQIERLEKEKELDNIFWKQECDSLQKTLAEKYKEIDNLKELRKFEIEDKEEIRKNRLQEIIKLEEELVEKDKEIEEYDNYFKSFGCKNFNEFQKLIGLTKISKDDKDRDNIIRHQVCDEIRQKLKEAELMYVWKGKYKSVETIIDQIEKGE